MDTPDPLTLDDIATLREIGPTRYMQRVIALFTSGRATPQQWAAATAALTLCYPGRPRTIDEDLARLQRRHATQALWLLMASAVCRASESAEGAVVAGIDQAVLDSWSDPRED